MNRAFCFLAGCLLASSLGATPMTPHVLCTIEQGGDTYLLESSPTDTPYTARAVNIGSTFRFKLVVVGTPTHIDYVKTYVYYQAARQPQLLHSAHYRPSPTISTHDLTGRNFVYASALERELQYSCQMVVASPQ